MTEAGCVEFVTLTLASPDFARPGSVEGTPCNGPKLQLGHDLPHDTVATCSAIGCDAIEVAFRMTPQRNLQWRKGRGATPFREITSCPLTGIQPTFLFRLYPIVQGRPLA